MRIGNISVFRNSNKLLDTNNDDNVSEIVSALFCLFLLFISLGLGLRLLNLCQLSHCVFQLHGAIKTLHAFPLLRVRGTLLFWKVGSSLHTANCKIGSISSSSSFCQCLAAAIDVNVFDVVG
jgi:hypothetical protein